MKKETKCPDCGMEMLYITLNEYTSYPPLKEPEKIIQALCQCPNCKRIKAI